MAVRYGAILCSLLTVLAFAAVPATSASSGCWSTDTSEQELVKVGGERAFLRIEQAMVSPDCSGLTQPWYMYCLAGGGVGGTSVTTHPVQTIEVGVLGITLVEGGEEVVASQTITVPTGADVPLLDDSRCTDKPLVVSVVVEGAEGDTVVGSDGTVSFGSLPFADAACGSLGAEDCAGLLAALEDAVRALAFGVLSGVVPACEDVSGTWVVCAGGPGPIGFLVKVPLAGVQSL